MNRYTAHESTASNVLAWTSHCAGVEVPVEEDASADVDEPPENSLSLTSDYFKRAPIRRCGEHHGSLLTKALNSQSEDDTPETSRSSKALRRRSITSNFSLTSTADLTSDTGITTPARTSSPSPHLPNVGFVPLVTNLKKTALPASSPRHPPLDGLQSGSEQPAKDPAVQALEKKRCISFACVAKPKSDFEIAVPSPSKPANEAFKAASRDAAKLSSITIACPARPDQGTSASVKQNVTSVTRKVGSRAKDGAPQKHRSPSAARSGRSLTPRPPTPSPSSARTRKYVRADTNDLQSQYARFHEFASDEPQEDDWITRDESSSKCKLTINDILEKENVIRKLGKEAEEEADLEDELDDEEADDDNDDEGMDDDDLDGPEKEIRNFVGYEDDHSVYGSDHDASDGYHSDNENGFAESDDEDDELDLWTMSQVNHVSLAGATPARRRASNTADHSDSSISSKIGQSIRARSRARRSRAVFRAGTPDLPDSTDFVCGTLDEDQPLEQAYISRITAKKMERHQLIPQDIDPSFPTSEPEDDDEELYKDGHADSDDQLFYGELEDLHHDQDRVGRKKKASHQSPKRYRSPPPKRVHSPAPKKRGRSPKKLFDRHSPVQLKPLSLDPAAQSPPGSPVHTAGVMGFKSLTLRPGLTHTKSLPKAPAMIPSMKSRRSRTNTMTKGKNHVRGAIDIVKGLEQKRHRRREKFYQKYCTRARKEKAQEKRPVRGQGAERMREIGLLMAGKIGQGNYVLSV